MKSIVDLRRDIKELFRYGLLAVDPYHIIKNTVRISDDSIFIKNGTSDSQSFDLRQFKRIYVFGMGKATAFMAKALEELLGDKITDGLIVVKYGYTAKLNKIRIVEAGHPVPDENGFKAAKEILNFLKSATEDDLVFFLISGGGSALLPYPADGITLDEKIFTTKILLACGANIRDMNAVRKHISEIKGGQLSRLAYPATVVSLILSDVIGDRLDTIASGPTVPDETTFADAFNVLEKYNIKDKVPKSVVARIEMGLQGKIPETPKPGEDVFRKTYNFIVGNNYIALQAIKEKAKDLGYNAIILSSMVEGEAREVAKVLCAVAKEAMKSGNPISPPACIICGGETTVTVSGNGLGGRNQELCLSAAILLEGENNIVLMSAGTDGTDGPTDAAGAIVDGTTVVRARKLGLNPQEYLKNNDSYNFFKKVGDLYITGPTNTNVMDVQIVLVAQTK
ncbi:MAG: glycerate kinase [bacterium]|nr:glycerate kinase [bacterium]